MSIILRYWPRWVTTGLICLMLGSAQASSVVINSTIVDIGAVNGTQKGGTLDVEYSLPNPVLLSFEQSQLNGTLHTLIIEQARLIEASGSRLTIQVQNLLDTGSSSTSTIVLGLWLDGIKKDIYASQQGSAITLQVPNTFRVLSLVADNPVMMALPKEYRGNYSLALRYRGLSSN